MNYKIEILDDCNVIYVRNKGKYGSNKNYEMMKNFKEWIKENCYWRYVETNGILGVALDDPQIVEEESCRYDLVLKIDEDVKINDTVQTFSAAIRIYCKSVFDALRTHDANQIRFIEYEL